MAGALRTGDPATVGPFQIHRRLGAGGMGQVYLGRDPAGRWAAVKVVHDAFIGDREFHRRFAREIDIAARVRAPWTVALLDADASADRPWLATEYIHGPSLEHAVGATGPLPEASLGVLASRLADALAALHSTGLVHRDLKPSNVMLAADGPRLVDFGIARAMDSSRITRTGLTIGTPAFMSPEQAGGEDGGPPTDLFALAAVLTFAATGSGPFGTSSNPVAMLLRVAESEPDLSGLPATLRDELHDCLAKDPAQRPTARQLATRLAHWTSPPAEGSWPPPAAAQLAEPPPTGDRPVREPGQEAWTPPDLPAGFTPTNTALRRLTGLIRTGRRPGRTTLALLTVSVVAALVLGLVLWAPWSSGGSPVPGGGTSESVRPPTRPVAFGTSTPIEVDRGIGYMAVAPDSSRAYIAALTTIMVVDTRTQQVVRTLPLPLGISANGLFVASDGALFVVGRDGMEIRDPDSGSVLAKLPIPDLALVTRGATSRDGRHIALITGGLQATKKLTVLDTVSRTVTAVVPLPDVSIMASGVALSSDGAVAYVSQLGAPLVRVDITAGRETPIAPVLLANALDISADGREVYAQSMTGGLINVLDTGSGRVLRRVNIPSFVGAFQSLPGGGLLAVDNPRRTVHAIDPGTGAVLATTQFTRPIVYSWKSPDGRVLYLAGTNGVDAVSVIEK
ncbi:protein kinase domain-containing protein [Pseudonocardia spinosispora]|uniref:protein kinase domain-containing protein n=1 Tax=Pseudonocardia spinosispora TaxID=103441 RepID=UPI00040CB8DE|nr:protein kinase [Pseudonocardia spinosispora]